MTTKAKPTPAALLAEVRNAKAKAVEWTNRLDEAIRNAAAHGVPIREIAEAAGKSGPGVRYILAREGPRERI